MGASLSKALSALFSSPDVNIVMVGLDGAGKTTILEKLKLGEIKTANPILGFSVEFVQYKNFTFTAWNVGGQDQSTASLVWKQYSQKTHGIIFVVDSNDRERISQAREQLHRMLDEAGPCDALLLVIANKQDLSNAMNSAEITDKLDLHGLSGKTWHIQAACATNGDGLDEGLKWLTERINRRAP